MYGIIRKGCWKGVCLLHIDKVEYESELTNALVVYQHRLFVDKLAATDLALLPMLSTHIFSFLWIVLPRACHLVHKKCVLLLLPTSIPTPLPMMTDVQILILLLLQDTLRQHGNELVVLQTQDSSSYERKRTTVCYSLCRRPPLSSSSQRTGIISDNSITLGRLSKASATQHGSIVVAESTA